MTVQYSIQKMVSDGTLSTIALGIQYLQRNDIYVRVAGEETPQSGATSGYTWSFIDNTTLKILPVVPNGVEVVVYRRTDVDAMYNIYSQNAQFDEATIDENNQQLLYIAQEYLEQGIPGAGVDIIEFIRDDGSFTYYRIKRTDGSYSDEFAVPSAGSITKVLAREALRRICAGTGNYLVDGSFQVGFTLVNSTDVALDEASGKVFSGTAGTYPSETSTSAFVDVSNILTKSYKTISDAISASDHVVGQRIIWRGYYQESDGGSNWGVVKYGPHVEDGGSIFSLGTDKYIEANLTDSTRISVLKFGAVRYATAGGSIDSYLNIKNALGKAIANRAKLCIPQGFYRTSQPLRFNDSLTIDMRGATVEFYGTSFLEVAKEAPYPSLFSLNGGSAIRRGASGIAIEIASGVVPTGGGFIEKVDIYNFYPQSCDTGIFVANARNVKISRCNSIHCDIAVDIVGQVVVSKIGNCDFIAGIGGKVVGVRYRASDSFQDGGTRIPENAQVYKNRVFGYNTAVDIQRLLFGSISNNDLDYCGTYGVQIGLTTDVEVRENYIALAENNTPNSACITITSKAGYSPANDGHEFHGNKLRCYDGTGGHGIFIGGYVRKVNITGTHTNTGLTFALLTSPNTQDINIAGNPFGSGAVRIQSDGVLLSGNTLNNCNLTGASNVRFGDNFGSILSRKIVIVPISAGATTGQLTLTDLPIGSVNLVCSPVNTGGLSRGAISTRFDGTNTLYVTVGTAFGAPGNLQVLVEVFK